MVPLSFAGETFAASRDGALFHPVTRSLMLADLHLEKSSFYARFGQFLPPQDSLATLEKLANAIARSGAERVYCLGDNYHDGSGERRLPAEASALLRSLTDKVDWRWIVGNHDPDLDGLHGGRIERECRIGDIVLRHQNEALGEGLTGEISGHWHPCMKVSRGRRQSARRPCFMRGQQRLIMPAFGALTGSMDCQSVEILDMFEDGLVDALVVLDDRLCQFAIGTPALRRSA